MPPVCIALTLRWAFEEMHILVFWGVKSLTKRATNDKICYQCFLILFSYQKVSTSIHCCF